MERKSPVNLRLSDAALDHIGTEEGCILYAYDDADTSRPKIFVTEENKEHVKGTLTIGFGHTRTAKPGQRVTLEEARSLLRSDVRDAESCVHRYVKVPLTQGEFDGMTDLFFNVGPGRMQGSNGPDDLGKDGIQCLGRTGGGRPSTLLTILNKPIPEDPESNYRRAAECFTQWRQPAWAMWTLLKRRIRFMLIFMGLPVVRAVNAFPNVMPVDDQARYDLVQACLRLAGEEKADLDGLKPSTEKNGEKPPAVAPAAPPAETVPTLQPAPKTAPAVTPAPKSEPAAPPRVESPKPDGVAVGGGSGSAPPSPLPPPPRTPPPPSVQVSNIGWDGLKDMMRSKRFYGGLLIVFGRFVIAANVGGILAPGPVAALIGDGILMDWTTGILANFAGEIIKHWGEKTATAPLGTAREVALATSPRVAA